MRQSTWLVVGWLGILRAVNCWADAGPPLLTDDPGTPGNNNWEINFAVTTEINREESRFEAPIADLNYGLGERIQLKYEVPWVLSRNRSESQSGFDQSIAGMKWRFFEQSGITLSSYPQYSFQTPASALKPTGDAQVTPNSFLLPIESQQHAGKFDFNEEIGYRIVQGDRNQHLYGLATSYPLIYKVTLLSELHGNIRSDFKDDELVMNIGSVIRASESIHVLVSIGHSLRTLDDAPATYLGYTGLQFVID